MNELCQKNGFTHLFEKILENIKQKQFKVRLRITNPANDRSLAYIGACNTVQNAKHSAAKRAIADDFVIKLKSSNNCQTYRAYTRPDSMGDHRPDYDKACSAARSDSGRGAGPNDAANDEHPPEVQPVDERNYVYDLYREARRLNLKLKIEFVSSQKGSLTSEVVVKLVIGSRITLGEFVKVLCV